MKSKQLLLLGIIFYLIISPFFYHPDLKIIIYLSQFLSQGVLNIYDFISTHPEFSRMGPFVYPPGAYFLLGSLFPLVKIIAGNGFTTWLEMGNDAVNVESLFRFLFAMKLPLIIVHAITGYFLTKLFEKEFEKKLMLLWWFLNPISIYAIAFMGQIDGLALLPLVAGMTFIKSRKFLSAALFGLGGAIKSFPLLFLPALAFLSSKKIISMIQMLVVGGAIYALFILGFVKTPAFFEQTLASGLTKKILANFVPVFLSLVFMMAYRDKNKDQKLIDYFLLISLIILAGINFHPQWGMWAVPFVGAWSIKNKNWFMPVFFMIAWAGVTFTIDDKFLSWGILSAIEPGVLFLPSIPSQVPSAIISVIVKCSHLLLAGLAAWVSINIFRQTEKES